VDIGATEFIHRQLMKARSEGKAVLLVSADLDELLALSDRIGVMFKGRIIREFTHENAVREVVGLAMTGEKADAAV
jgi:simple sugar transport system ATP-binding protein